MRFILAQALFAPQSQRESHELARLLFDAALTEVQPPVVLLDPPYVLGGANQDVDAWLDKRGAEEATLFRDLLVRSNVLFNGPRGVAAVDPTPNRPPAWRFVAAPDVRVERRAGAASDWPALSLTLADAIELLHEPVHLVLENDLHDLAFVRHLAGPTDGRVLRDLERAAGRLHAHGGGGGQAKTWLEALAEPPATPEKWRRVLRTWVLFDQDAGDPDAREPARNAEQMMEACERVHATFAVGLSWICLRRREIESYVPDRGLREEASADRLAMVQQIIAWRGAAPPGPGNATDHRRHAWAFDIKKGLVGDLRSDVPKVDRDAVKARHALPIAAALKTPFDTLTHADVALLAYGLGEKRLNDAFTRDPPPGWTADIPTEYDRGLEHQAPRLALVQSLLDRI